MEDLRPGYVKGKTPGPGQVHAVLEGVGVEVIGGDDKGQAGGIKQKLREEFGQFNCVLMYNWEESWSADHES